VVCVSGADLAAQVPAGPALQRFEISHPLPLFCTSLQALVSRRGDPRSPHLHYHPYHLFLLAQSADFLGWGRAGLFHDGYDL
jgi:hypothetical protein